MKTPIIISWQYIAGFFDGEGCISTHDKASPNRNNIQAITIVQKVDSNFVLEEIQKFLAKRNIPSHLYNSRSAGNINWKPTHALTISGKKEQLAFLRWIKKYLVVKKDKATQTVNYLQSTKYRKKRKTRVSVLESARQDYKNGLSFREAAGKRHIDAGTLRRYMLSLGERGRSVKESVELWHKTMPATKREKLKASMKRSAKKRWAVS